MNEPDTDLTRSRARLVLLFACFAGLFLLLCGRLVVFASIPGEVRGPAAVAQAGRADIVDRNGVLLATNLRAPSAYAHPQLIRDPEGAAVRLAEVLGGTDAASLAALLAKDTPFIWLKRQLSPEEEQGILELGIPGVDLITDEQRAYPHGPLAGHVLGFVDQDSRGLAGIERSFESRLREQTDEPLALSLDVRVQTVVRDELARAIATFGAVAGNAIVLEVPTGAVLAMVSLPDFDPNFRNRAPVANRFNRNTMGLYEVGSMFKLFTAAAALDEGAFGLQSRCDATEPIWIGKYAIRDFQPKRRQLSFAEAIMFSSNICAARMGLSLGPERQKASLERFGLLARTAVEVPEVAAPQQPPAGEVWRTIRTATVSFGYGVSVTPVHIAQTVAALIGDGVLHPATLLAEPGPSEQRRIVSAETSARLRWLMWATATHGSGRRASIDGYLVGGKTGTANKRRRSGSGYDDDRRLSSFVGAFPMDRPRYVVLVMLDEPKPTAEAYGFATGGVVSAPAVGAIIQRIGPLLGEPLAADGADVAFTACLGRGEAINGRTKRKEPSFAAVCADL